MAMATHPLAYAEPQEPHGLAEAKRDDLVPGGRELVGRTPSVDEFVETVAKPSAEVLDVEASFCANREVVGLHVQAEARLKLILPSDYVIVAAFNGLATARALVDDDPPIAHRHHPFTYRHTARASRLTGRIAGGAAWLPGRRPALTNLARP
jgi:hypothetical protein